MARLLNIITALQFTPILAPILAIRVHADSTGQAVGGAEVVGHMNSAARDAAKIIQDIITSITPIFRLAGVVLLAFYVIKFIIALTSGDDTQSKTQSIIMIVVSIGLIFWEELLSPLTNVFNSL